MSLISKLVLFWYSFSSLTESFKMVSSASISISFSSTSGVLFFDIAVSVVFGPPKEMDPVELTSVVGGGGAEDALVVVHCVVGNEDVACAVCVILAVGAGAVVPVTAGVVTFTTGGLLV